ncbi:hypothetical protein [Iningainema tapete]|uniref:Uncharacterized protein n=1 Tax=Iningainema tapete BLCC-T55 TaxID=2748662 RepID=A0A8J6XLS6_9CYAN|nr:hypothetical protein [Iningainema tapete]MBD2777143.1 hypothetical protein [Iningainema tapete BLCC-T55]
MLKTTATNSLRKAESTLWEDLSDAEAQSLSGGLTSTVSGGIVLFSLQSLPPTISSTSNNQITTTTTSTITPSVQATLVLTPTPSLTIRLG